MECHSLDLAVGLYYVFMTIVAVVSSDPCWDLLYQGCVTKEFRNISSTSSKRHWVLSPILWFFQCLLKVWALDLVWYSDLSQWRPYPGSATCWARIAQTVREKVDLCGCLCWHHQPWAQSAMHPPRLPPASSACPTAQLGPSAWGIPEPKCTWQINLQWASLLSQSTTPMTEREVLGGTSAAWGSKRMPLWTQDDSKVCLWEV